MSLSALTDSSRSPDHGTALSGCGTYRRKLHIALRGELLKCHGLAVDVLPGGSLDTPKTFSALRSRLIIDKSYRGHVTEQ